jgi:hypothetical protein
MIPFNGSEWIGIENSLRILADGLLNSKAKVLAEERPKTRLGLNGFRGSVKTQ